MQKAQERERGLKSDLQQRAALQRRYLRRLAISYSIVLLYCSVLAVSLQASESKPTTPLALPMIEGRGIRFRRLPTTAGLSQTRVSNIVQDDKGFIWFGTQDGLNRFDGYSCKVFRHDPQNPDSLSGAYIRELFKDRSGFIWVASDQFLDRLDPTTEAFRHYSLVEPNNSGPDIMIGHISQDGSGLLWLSTSRGLFRVDPATGRSTQFLHDPKDPATIGDDAVSSTGEDRRGRFWVGTGETLDEFDRTTGKVKRHIAIPDSGMGVRFHEDRFGIFWIFYGWDGLPATLDPESGKLTRFRFNLDPHQDPTNNRVYAMLEDRNGDMWFGTAANGILKFDRQHRRFVAYSNRVGDSDSLADNRVTTLFEDREGTIWVGLHQAEPNFFTTNRPPFERFIHQSGNPNSLDAPLVSALYEDHDGVLWVGNGRGVTRINRNTGQYSTFRGITNTEVLSIIEQGPDYLWFGTSTGFKRYDRNTQRPETFRSSPGSSPAATEPAAGTCAHSVAEKLLIDHAGTLWGATWEGLCRFDSSTKRFLTFKPKANSRGLNYHAIALDKEGKLWIGSEIGLHRFDPVTSRFTVYSHRSNDPRSLSDNRVNTVYFDHDGTLWVGTQDGLDKFDPRTDSFSAYGERQGMRGNVVSCVLEDGQGSLWMSTNKGISKYDPRKGDFKNYTVADGLPGDDLTGWGACFKNGAGEMFFGGFSGATAFFPNRIADDTYLPPVVLTDFRLHGNSVPVGKNSLLRKSIDHTDKITLPHTQNAFSIEFSALSYLDAETNRYRYRLDGFDTKWNDTDSTQRIAAYTALKYGTYTFRVEGATSHGYWNEPGTILRIQILPAWWETWWLRVASSGIGLALLWQLYQARIRGLRRQEKKLRNVIETMPIFAWTARPDGSVDFVNHHWERFTGLSSERTVGSGWQEAVHPEDLGRYLDERHISIESEQPLESELRYRAKDGQFRWFLVRAVPLRDPRGKIVKWYGSATDIEDRKRAEQLQADLTHASRLSTMGELVASISHELAQPLTVTTAHARASLRWLQRDPPGLAEVRQGMEKIIEATVLASDIITRLRLLYKKAPPKRELLAINEVISEMTGMISGKARDDGVSICIELKDGLPMTVADRVQLQQVLMNLMLNSVEAMKDTGGVLRVKSQLGDAGQIEISVEDTGPGLSQADAGQIFDAFFTTKAQGSGMGLAISKTIIESHGGRIWADSDPGNGATFHFTLSAAPKDNSVSGVS
jgi:PAS domain S-box-containing protein